MEKEIKKKINKKQIVIMCIILAIVILGMIIMRVNSQKRYENKLIETSKEMFEIGVTSEKIANNFINLWGEKIDSNATTSWTRPYIAQQLGIDTDKFLNNTSAFKYDDEAITFDDVLRCYGEFNNNVGINKTLIDGLNDVETNITELNNCPTKFKRSYDALVQMYADLEQFTNLAISPKGSLLSYRDDIGSLDKKITNEYSIFKTQLPNGIQ